MAVIASERVRSLQTILAHVLPVFAALLLALLPLALAPLADASPSSANEELSPVAVDDRSSSVASLHPYVALGDSVAVGVGATSPALSYVGRLHTDYQASLGVNELLNRSQSGTTSSSLISGGQLTLALADINSASDTEAVTIDIGGSDYLNGQCTTNWGDPSTCPYGANLASILAQLQSALDADPGAEQFAAMAYYNPGVGTASEGTWDRAELGADFGVGCLDSGADVGLNDVIYQEAGKLGIAVADPSAAFNANGQALMADSVHPNDTGHAAIAESFLDARIPCAGTPPPAADTTPPTTTITKGAPNKTEKTAVRFKFKSSEPNSTFECRLDEKRWKRCKSPRRVDHLDVGRHKFRVRATDVAGNTDPTPGKDKFKVVN